MTTNNTATDAVKESGKPENIKQLNAMHGGTEINSLLTSIKETKRKLESVLNTQRDRERDINEKKKELKRIAEEEAAAKKPQLPVYDEIKEETVPTQQTAKEESFSSVENIEHNQEPIASEKAAEPAPDSSQKESSDGVRTMQFDHTPSYIKGTYTPKPAYVPQQRPQAGQQRPPYNNAQGGQGNQRQGGYQQRPNGANQPYNNNGQSRPPYNNNGTGQRAPYNNNGQRPMGAGGAAGTGIKRPSFGSAPKIDLPSTSKDRSKTFDKKKDFTKADDKKGGMNKRTLIRKGFIQEGFDEDRSGVRKLKNKKNKNQPIFVPQKIEKAIITTENLTVKILSEKIGVTAQEIIKKLMILGTMCTINSVVDFATMELVASEFGVELELKLDKTKEELLEQVSEEVDNEENLVKRPPVITVMGHVDHGKTSLLDAIKKTNVVTGEAGGITQHIGAYSVVWKNEKITFLDTPGHEAFTEMRARGAKVTDIAILVVAADDGIMPQTIEAINHAKAAEVPVIVAINKIDKPGANIDKVKQTLTEFSLVAEEWGGDTMMVPISAKSGEGIDKLLESILLLAEVNEYKANPERKAKGSIIEAKLDKGKGPVANIIVQTGTLSVGNIVVSGTSIARVRGMIDDKGRAIKEAGPSTPVSIQGFNEVPNAGDSFFVVDDEKFAKQVVAERTAKFKNEQTMQTQSVSLDDMFTKISEQELKDLNIIIKADVQGSVEALKTSLLKIQNEEARVKIVHGAVGAINKSDIMLAEVSKAIIIGFNVRPDAESKTLAENAGIDIRMYRIIYEAIEDIERAIKGMLSPKYRENSTGKAEVRNVFKITGTGIVAGSYITSGKIYRNSKARVYRGEELVYEGAIEGLKRFKDDVKEVAEGYECGISLDGFSEIKEGDIIEAYLIEEIKN